MSGFDKSDFREVVSIDHSKCPPIDTEWISEKQSGLDIFSSNLISVKLFMMRSWQVYVRIDFGYKTSVFGN